MNLYVGNLSYKVSEEDLKNAFQQFGEVTEARLITDNETGRSKGFGFVEMPSKDEAENAIEQMNDKEFMGRNIKVNIAKPKKDNRRGGSGGRGRPGSGRPQGGQRGRGRGNAKSSQRGKSRRY